MSGPTKPYLYSNCRQVYQDPFGNDAFDPKAVTRASWTRAPPKPKQEGPLINFNRHPDSWQQAPYGQTDAVPMPATTKRNVKAVRWTQLAFRIITFIAALGVLVCMICLSNIPSPMSVIIRAAPGLDVLATGYGIFHLARSAKAKAPASSASYHLFSILLDLPLIVFYVFIALNDKWNVTQPINNKARWRSLFKSQTVTNALIDYSWLISIVVAGLHLLTAFIAVYLCRMYRKISKLPPDLNPLEDNLTSRRKSKHKYKNSDVSVVSEKHSKHDSGVSLPWEDKPRPVSFINTRNESATQLYSPHNPKTANESRASLPLVAPSAYSQPSSERLSRVNVGKPEYASSQAPSQAPSQAQTHTTAQPTRAGSPLKQTELSRLNSVAASSVYSDSSNGSAPILPRKSSKRTSGTFSSSENWYAFHDGEDDNENREPAFSILEEEDEEVSQIEAHSQPRRPYQPIRQSSVLDLQDGDLASDRRYAPTPSPKLIRQSTRDSTFESTNTFQSLQPLGMNPPTPPPQAAGRNSPRPNSRANTPAAPLITTSGPSTPTRNSPSPTKGRYYGDLQSAVQGVRHSPQASPTYRHKAANSRHEPGVATNTWLAPTYNRLDEKRQERHNQAQYEQRNSRMDGQGRVVSRSGADLGDGGGAYYEDVPPEFLNFQGNNARNVSGKVVEEGWGGGWARRRISGR